MIIKEIVYLCLHLKFLVLKNCNDIKKALTLLNPNIHIETKSKDETHIFEVSENLINRFYNYLLKSIARKKNLENVFRQLTLIIGN